MRGNERHGLIGEIESGDWRDDNIFRAGVSDFGNIKISN